MKHRSIFLAFSAMLVFSQQLMADDNPTQGNWYTSINLGLAQQRSSYPAETSYIQNSWDFDSGADISASAGYKWRKLRLEVELAYRKMSLEHWSIPSINLKFNGTGNQTQRSILANIFYQPMTEWELSPYIGGGLGLTKIAWNDIRLDGVSGSSDDSDNVLTYQVIAGVSYNLTSHFSLDAAYKYICSEDIEIDGGKYTDQKLNVYTLGVRYNY